VTKATFVISIVMDTDGGAEIRAPQDLPQEELLAILLDAADEVGAQIATRDIRPNQLMPRGFLQ
jgi:hypothetical protein